MTTVKDPTGIFMRLMWKVWLDTGESVSVEKRKISYALRSKVDEKIEEYFADNPEQAPGRLNQPPNRLGSFMRTVQEWRSKEKEYRTFKKKDDLNKLYLLHKRIGEHLESFFKQKPEEAPNDIMNPQQPTLFDL